MLAYLNYRTGSAAGLLETDIINHMNSRMPVVPPDYMCLLNVQWTKAEAVEFLIGGKVLGNGDSELVVVTVGTCRQPWAANA